MPGHRTDVDDRSALADRATEVFAAQEHTGQIDVDDVLPLGEGGTIDALEDRVHAGVVDQNVDAATALQHGFAQCQNVGFLGHVGGDDDCPFADRASRLFQGGTGA